MDGKKRPRLRLTKWAAENQPLRPSSPPPVTPTPIAPLGHGRCLFAAPSFFVRRFLSRPEPGVDMTASRNESTSPLRPLQPSLRAVGVQGGRCREKNSKGSSTSVLTVSDTSSCPRNQQTRQCCVRMLGRPSVEIAIKLELECGAESVLLIVKLTAKSFPCQLDDHIRNITHVRQGNL